MKKLPIPWTKKTNMAILPSADGWTYGGTAGGDGDPAWTNTDDMTTDPAATTWSYAVGDAPLVRSDFISLAGGILTLDSEIHGGTNYMVYYKNILMVNATGHTHEFKMKVISKNNNAYDAGLTYWIRDNAWSEQLQFKMDGIHLQNANISFAMDTHTDFHIYRITIKGTAINVYVDGIVRLTAVLSVADASQYVNWGDQPVSGGHSKSEWDYLKYSIAGVFVPIMNSVASGILTMDSEGVGGTVVNDYQKTTAFNNAVGSTAEFRMKYVSGSVAGLPLCFDHDDGTWVEVIEFYPYGIYTYFGGQAFVATINDGLFHTYRTTIIGTTFNLYRDDVLIITEVLAQASVLGNAIYFGDVTATNGENSKSEWDYVYYYIGGAIPPYSNASNIAYKVKLFDEYGQKYAELSNETDQKLINNISFELLPTGCGAFTINFAILPSYSIRRNDIVEIYLMGQTAPWYSGFIQNIPEAGRTDNSFVYSGYGFIAQLDTVVANTTYAALEASVMAFNLLSTYAFATTKIIYNAAKIIASAITVNSSIYDYTKIKKALSDLALQAGDYITGVDEVREFFFKPRDTTIQQAAVKAIEYHVGSFTPSENVSNIVNRYYVKGSAIAGGSNYMTMVEDLASQAIYGLCEDVLTIPTTDNVTDATAYATNQLAKRKDSVITATVSNIDINFLGEKITADGKARILLRRVD